MKKAIILPFLLLFTVLITSCSKDDEAPANDDKSAEVSQTYQGRLQLGNGADVLIDYNNVKVKVTRKGTHEVTLEPVSDQGYPAFAPIAYSKFMWIPQSDGYISSNPGPITFTFTSSGSIVLKQAYALANVVVFFEGSNVK